ncbi:protein DETOXIFICATION 49-like [Benincasa hispida]|uniref:protein DETOXIFICATION 49-like n=1 Tax=Benincasa hispida TaxID=102211 RepID=UPI0019013E8B|nr:protein DETOXIFICATION 49-like [Benincasa hispida]
MSASESVLSDEQNIPTLKTPLISESPTEETETELPYRPHVLTESKCIASVAFPMILVGFLMYFRSVISMMFLGRLGGLSLAGGSLAIGFANITGYSVLSGLATGMEPICGQAFGAKKFKLLGLALQRTIILLLISSLPISFLWFNMKKILLFFGQNEDIANEAHSYILCSLPDLIALSFFHPLRIYLRSQSINLPITCCAILAILFHIPINYLFVSVLEWGTRGVALGAVWTNFNLVGLLVIFILVSGVYKKTWPGMSSDWLKEWKLLLELAIPSCISVCLEWWWYEIMTLLSGFMLNPQSTIASMGILIQTTALIYIFPSSLSLGVSTRVGNELGANHPNGAKLAAIVGLCTSFFFGISALVFAFSIRKVWATMFTKDIEIIELTSTILPIIGLCELGNCPQTTSCGVLRGTARPKLGANINLGCFYMVGMPVAIWLSFYAGWDFKGLWIGLLAAQGSCAITMLMVLVRTNWEEQAERAKELTRNGVVEIENDDEEENGELQEEEEEDDDDDDEIKECFNSRNGRDLIV